MRSDSGLTRGEAGAVRSPFCSQNAHTQKYARSMRAVKGNLDHSLEQMFGAEEGMEPDDLLCSRNARSRTPLVGRAQWEINQAPSLKR